MLLKPGTNTGGGYATMSYTVTLDKATDVVIPTKLHHTKNSVPENYSCRIYWNAGNSGKDLTSTPVYLGTGSTQAELATHYYGSPGTYTIRVVSYRPNFPAGYSSIAHPLITESNTHFEKGGMDEALRLISFANYTTGVLKDGDSINVSRCKDLSGVLAWFKLSDKFCGRKLNTSSCKYANYIAVAPDDDTYGDDNIHYPDGAVTNTAHLFTQIDGIEEAVHAFRGRHWLERASGDFNSLIRGEYMFYGCSKLQTISGDFNSLIRGTCMFYGCSKLQTINNEEVAGSKFAALSHASKMFYDCTALKSSVFCNMTGESIIYATQMFYGCSGNDFKYLHNVSNSGAWSLPNVVEFNGFLQNCTKVNTLPPYFLAKAESLGNFRNSLSDIQLHNINGTDNYFGSVYYNIGASAKTIFSRICPFTYDASTKKVTKIKQAGASRVKSNGTNVNHYAYFWIGVPKITDPIGLSGGWAWKPVTGSTSTKWNSGTGNTDSPAVPTVRAYKSSLNPVICYYMRHTLYDITIAAGLLAPGDITSLASYSTQFADVSSIKTLRGLMENFTFDTKGWVLTTYLTYYNRIGGTYYVDTSNAADFYNKLPYAYNFVVSTDSTKLFGSFIDGQRPAVGRNNQSVCSRINQTGTSYDDYIDATWVSKSEYALATSSYQYYCHMYYTPSSLVDIIEPVAGKYMARYFGKLKMEGNAVDSTTTVYRYLNIPASSTINSLYINRDASSAQRGSQSATIYSASF